MSEADYEIKNAKPLLDGKIIGFFKEKGDEGYWGFVVQKDKKFYDVWVNCDPEGNGPGHLSIEEQTK
jgi:hypothetical protein